jgi:hypothetical protein
MKKYKKDIIQIGILIILFGGIVFGERIWYKLFPAADQYGIQYNKERKRRGILPLPGSWTTEDNDKETKVWFPAEGDTGAVRRTMKVIGVSYDRIRFENDFIQKSLPNKEELTISYRYDTTHPWTYTVSSELTKHRPYVITGAQMDSILKDWNFHINN